MLLTLQLWWVGFWQPNAKEARKTRKERINTKGEVEEGVFACSRR